MATLMTWWSDGSVQITEAPAYGAWLHAKDGHLCLGDWPIGSGDPIAESVEVPSDYSTAEALRLYAADAGLMRLTVNGEQIWPYPDGRG